MSTLKELLGRGQGYLEERGIAEAGLDAWYLLEDLLGIDRTYYYLHMDEQVSAEQERNYQKLVEKRGRHVPLQHILGRAWFMGLEFLVNGQVLIPRQDTEVLVEQVVPLVKPGMKVLDMCTGSGCILLGILHFCPHARGIGVDVSQEALEVAGENSRRLGIPAEFLCSDLFQDVLGKYDVIVSNPPYIPTGEIPQLMEEVRDHEPLLALDGEQDGLAFYRRIAGEAGSYLNPQGVLAFEIGCEQGSAVRGMMEQRGYRNIRIVQDLAGLDRVVLGEKGE